MRKGSVRLPTDGSIQVSSIWVPTSMVPEISTKEQNAITAQR